jgi:hypothetical protein
VVETEHEQTFRYLTRKPFDEVVKALITLRWFSNLPNVNYDNDKHQILKEAGWTHWEYVRALKQNQH